MLRGALLICSYSTAGLKWLINPCNTALNIKNKILFTIAIVLLDPWATKGECYDMSNNNTGAFMDT